MTSPREGAARPEGVARKILRLENEKDERIESEGGADTSGYAVYCYQCGPDLARAYLDLLEASRAVFGYPTEPSGPSETDVRWQRMEELCGFDPLTGEFLGGPSHEGRNA